MSAHSSHRCWYVRLAAPAGVLALGLACSPVTDDVRSTRGGRVDAYFNEPGTRLANMWDPDAIDVMINLIDGAQERIDFAVMGFSHPGLVDAFVRAYLRGVQVRMVGDASHVDNSGYRTMYHWHIPLVTGNLAHIMHDKFMIVDRRFVFASTANWTPTDLEHNSNNFVHIDSPFVAADFHAEFEQLWNGLFGHQKVEIDNGRRYVVGDSEVEVWFSPNEDAMGRILELVDAAEESIRFTIFAFTKDQVGSAFIRKQEAFVARDLAEGVDVEGTDFRDRRSIAGVIDRSQLHSNQQFHEAFRLLGAGVPMRMDGNDSSQQPGDYQAGGGRLHSKTMVIDAHGANPVVISGSFNWSASATQSNDEYLLVFHGPRIAGLYDAYFESVWQNAKRVGIDFVGERIPEGAIRINEVMWYGVHANDIDGNDEFIELINLTDLDVQLDMWQIAGVDDFVVGLPPGSTIPARGTFTILDHVLERYADGQPQDAGSAYTEGDLVVNPFNDNRGARLYLKDSAMELFLLDPAATVVDVAGNGGPPFAGGPDRELARSMERLPDAADGSIPEAWATNTSELGGTYVSPDPMVQGDPSSPTYREMIRATPGEENSVTDRR